MHLISFFNCFVTVIVYYPPSPVEEGKGGFSALFPITSANSKGGADSSVVENHCSGVIFNSDNRLVELNWDLKKNLSTQNLTKLYKLDIYW